MFLPYGRGVWPGTCWRRVKDLIQRPEYVFLFLGAVFGVVFMVLTPPFQVPDEPHHFFRAYQISQGGLLPVTERGIPGGRLPVGVKEAADRFSGVPCRPGTKVSLAQIASADRVPTDPDRTAFVAFPGSALYAPTNYLPQVPAILIGRLLGLGVITTLYLARAFALAFWLAAVFLAVRTTPVGKPAFVAVSLLPITLFLAPGVSADTVTYAVVALVVSCALKYSLQEGSLSAAQLRNVILLGLVLSTLKMPYNLLFLVFLLVPVSKVSGRTARIAWASGLLACALVVAVWTGISAASSPATAVRYDVSGRPSGFVTSPASQMALIGESPGTLATALWRTYTRLEPYPQIIGVLGWVDTPMPLAAYLLGYWVLVCGLLMVESRLSAVPARTKAIQAGVVGGVFLLVNVALYLGWNAVGSDVIEGIQGRYLLPLILACIPLLAMRRRGVLEEPRRRAALTTAMYAVEAVLLTLAAYSLFVRYFVA